MLKSFSAFISCFTLWHGGRTSHTEYAGEQPIAPSPLKIRDVPRSSIPYKVPREMTKDEIRRVTEEFRKAAEKAKETGFDGAQVHGATGYLIDEFFEMEQTEGLIRTEAHPKIEPNSLLRW